MRVVGALDRSHHTVKSAVAAGTHTRGATRITCTAESTPRGSLAAAFLVFGLVLIGIFQVILDVAQRAQSA